MTITFPAPVAQESPTVHQARLDCCPVVYRDSLSRGATHGEALRDVIDWMTDAHSYDDVVDHGPATIADLTPEIRTALGRDPHLHLVHTTSANGGPR